MSYQNRCIFKLKNIYLIKVVATNSIQQTPIHNSIALYGPSSVFEINCLVLTLYTKGSKKNGIF